MWSVLLFGLVLLTLTAVTASSSGAIPALVLKSDHSGSSWFVWLIDNIEGVYLTEEIFHTPWHLKRENVSVDNIEVKSLPYLVESFQHPTGKYGRGGLKVESKRWKVLGATLNPIHAFYLNWAGIPSNVPNLRLIHYWRSNKVKHVIANIRAELLNKNCGFWTLNAKAAKHNCVAPTKINVSVKKFHSLLHKVMNEDHITLEIISKLTRKLKRKTWYTVTYEELLRDEEKAIQDLLNWILNSDHNFGEASQVLPTTCLGNCTKITSDNLRDVVNNYEEIEEWLREHYPCLLPQLHEEKPYVVQPDLHSLCLKFNLGESYKRWGNILEKI